MSYPRTVSSAAINYSDQAAALHQLQVTIGRTARGLRELSRANNHTGLLTSTVTRQGGESLYFCGQRLMLPWSSVEKGYVGYHVAHDGLAAALICKRPFVRVTCGPTPRLIRLFAMPGRPSDGEKDKGVLYLHQHVAVPTTTVHVYGEVSGVSSDAPPLDTSREGYAADQHADVSKGTSLV